jgi:hypothetical protein
MDVELVQSRIIRVADELNLELKLILRDGEAAHPAVGADTGAAPCPIRSTGWELSGLDGGAGLLA